MSRAALMRKTETAAPKAKVPTGASLQIGEVNDAYEQEADRVADAVMNGQASPAWTFSKVNPGKIQRQGDQPSPNPNNYKDAAGKFEEAFLKTDIGKKLTDAASNNPLVKDAENFIGTLPGKIIAGAAATGAVSAMAATHTALPMQIPEISLDKIRPGLSVKITYEGPVDHPTKAMITFSYAPKGDDKKPKQTESERYRAETARIAADQEKFRAGMTYKPGSPEDLQQKAEKKAIEDYTLHRFGAVPGTGGQPLVPSYPALQQSQDTGLHMPTFESPFKPKPFHLLDQQLELKPITSSSFPFPDEKKKEELALVQRKAEHGTAQTQVPATVREVLRSDGASLDARTRSLMESKMGFDFGKVRIHSNAQAAASAKAMNAKAYTVGRDVVFGAGQYSSNSFEGQKLLAHELAHTIQQDSSIQQAGNFNGLKKPPPSHYLSAKHANRLQRKLTIGASSDPLEQEADGVADQVMRMPAQVSRKCAACEDEDKVKLQAKSSGPQAAGYAPPIVHDVLNSGGRPLEGAISKNMGSRFGYDFSHVRVHTDDKAAQSARDVNAHAYTVGNNIVFGSGKYAPGSNEGKRLLAHELTHVVQQKSDLHAQLQRDAEDVQALDDAYKAAVESGDWQIAAEKLNAFNQTDIETRKSKLKKWQIANIYQGAIDNHAVGPNSAVANATRAAWLDLNFENAVKVKSWKDAAQFLNGFNRDDILARIQWRSIADLQLIRIGAVENPLVGEKSQLVQLIDATIAAKSQSAPAQSTKTSSSNTDGGGGSGNYTADLDAGAGLNAPEIAPALTEDDARNCTELYEQKLCFYERSGIGGDRSGVMDAEEAKSYNQACRQETDYTGYDVTLNADEIEELQRPRCARGTAQDHRKRERDVRIADALARSSKYGKLGEEIVKILQDPVFQISVSIGIALYLGLWVMPEPLISKASAILTTIALMSIGGFSAITIYRLAQAWSTLDEEAGNATSDEEIERAAEHFGRRITADEAQVIVFLASLIVGKALPGPKGRVPSPTESMNDAQSLVSSAGGSGVVVESTWGRAYIMSGGAGGSYVEGTSALKIENYAAQPVPDALPGPTAANDNALPLSANDNASAAAAAKGTKPIITLTPGLGAKTDPSKKVDPKKSYPLFWSPLLAPVPSTVFVRTPGHKRDTNKAVQALMQLQWRQFRDPDFKAKWVHVHHVIPLFLGGPDDLVHNGVIWPAHIHLKGHRDLRVQPQMLTPPNGLPPLPVDLYEHPAQTLYSLAGYKGGPGAPPSISTAFNESGDPADGDFESE